jgi:hypothetical protein
VVPPRYLLADATGARHRLAFDDPTGPLPLLPGERYDVSVDYVMGRPSPCGIVVTDAQGLVLAAASDRDIGAAVLADGVPGFTLRLVPTGCPSRPVSKCFTSRVNAVLEVTRSGRTIRLRQGERGRLGNYQVACHIAEHVTYARGCADAGVFQVSYTIRRVP